MRCPNIHCNSPYFKDDEEGVCLECGCVEQVSYTYLQLHQLNELRDSWDLDSIQVRDIPTLSDLEEFFDVQITPKNRPSESQQTQGVKSSDLGVSRSNVL